MRALWHKYKPGNLRLFIVFIMEINYQLDLAVHMSHMKMCNLFSVASSIINSDKSNFLSYSTT
jgi:hypothetical protein